MFYLNVRIILTQGVSYLKIPIDF